MKKLALLGVVALVISSVSGCGLCLLPCYICAAFADPSTTTIAVDERDEALAEVGPTLQTTAMTRSVAH
jgi:hypothetical protein